MEIRISEIMKRDVYAISPKASVAEAMRYMAEKGTSSLPILDHENHLEGFLSATDLMSYAFKLGKKHNPLFAENLSELHEEDLLALHALKVELESEAAIGHAKKSPFVYIDDTYNDACRILGKKNIKKVPVLDHDEKVVGILSRSTMVRYLFNYHLQQQKEKEL